MWSRVLVLVAAVTVFTAVIVAPGSAAQEDRLVTYPVPVGRGLSSDYSVRIRSAGGEWKPVDVHEVTVDRDTYSKAGMVVFDTGGPVEVAVTKTSGTIRSARVRPLSYGITPVISADAKTATFTLSRPQDVSLETNADVLHNLHVFAGSPETAVPQEGTRVMFFGPGVHEIGGDHILRIPSNTTVYVAGGAVVEGSLRIVNARNVVVRGKGIIDPSRFFAPKTGATLLVGRSTDVGIRDITLLRAQDGGITVANSARVVVAGVREITTDPSSDGIFVTASRDVLVDDVFLRTSDDAIAVYATTPWYGKGGTRNVTVRNSTLWADVAHPFLTGTHGDPDGRDVIDGIAMQNVDILEHDVRGGDLYEGALAVNAGDRVTVQNIRFDDIRIEDFSRGQVVNLKVFRNAAYNRRVGLKIDHVLFRNVSYTGDGDSPSSVRGYAPARRVTNVTFENMTRNGQTVLEPAVGNIVVGPHAANIAFRRQPSTRAVNGADRAIGYAGAWLRRSDAASDAGDVHTALKAGSRLVYPFTARQARVIGVTGPAAGKVDVYVDGKYAATVDAYSGARRTQQIWYDTGVLSAGRHTLELRYRGARNVLATGATVAFDRLEIVS
jgi:Glycosyl hydrolases family 28